MKDIAVRLLLVGAVVLMPLAANATMTDAEAGAMVKSMLADNKSATEIIETLMSDGRSLQDATVLSVKNAEGDARFILARVGICLSEDATRAEEVGRACAEACSPETRDIIESLIEGYVAGSCDPPEYDQYSTPGGGGSVSPSN